MRHAAGSMGIWIFSCTKCGADIGEPCNFVQYSKVSLCFSKEDVFQIHSFEETQHFTDCWCLQSGQEKTGVICKTVCNHGSVMDI